MNNIKDFDYLETIFRENEDELEAEIRVALKRGLKLFESIRSIELLGKKYLAQTFVR